MLQLKLSILYFWLLISASSALLDFSEISIELLF